MGLCVSMARSFWAMSERRGECLIWRGSVDALGYGRCERFGERGAHRVAWKLRRGNVAKGRLRNLCGNRLCVSPEHWAEPQGKPVSKRQERRAEIARMYADGMRIGEIAAAAGCSRTAVWRNLKGVSDGQAVSG